MGNTIYIFINVLLCIYFCYNKKLNIYVQISTASLSYMLYLPIVVKSWNLLGYRCIVVMAYHRINSNILYIKSILINLRAEVVLAKFNKTTSLHYASKISRIFGYEISRGRNNNDIFYLSDADMIPISKPFFYDYDKNKLTIKSFGPNGYGYGNNKGRWAMCFMVAKKSIWKDILKNDVISKNLTEIVTNVIISQLRKGKKYFEDYVYIDEVYLRDKIKDYNKFKINVIFRPRVYSGKNRIDRIKWPKNISNIDKRNIIDIHLPSLSAHKNILYIWKSLIIPLQKYVFNKVPYGIDYLYNLGME